MFCLIWHRRFDRTCSEPNCFYSALAYFIVFCLIWQYLLGRFDGFCGISFSVCIMYLLFYVILPFAFCLLLFYFILFLVDVLQSGIWRDANSLVDPSLRRLVPNLLHAFTVGVQGSFHRAEIQIWLAEVASMGSS